MKEFTNSSLPKVLVWYAGVPDDITYTGEGYPDWFCNTYDVIITDSEKEAQQIFFKHVYDLTLFITVSDKQWQEVCTWMQQPCVCLWMKKKWTHTSNHDIYNIIQEQLYEELNNDICPMFSVVVSLYKTKEDYLRKLICSLQYQSFTDWELVLSDDTPSGIDIKTVIDEYSEDDPRIRYFKSIPSNGNIGLAKWRANSFATGKWLYEMDHDDVLPYWSLQYHYDAIQMFPDTGFVYSDTAPITTEDDFIPSFFGTEPYALGFTKDYNVMDPNGIYSIPVTGTPDINQFTMHHIVSVPNHSRVWKRDVYYRINGHSKLQRIADDYELLIRTFLETKFVHIVYPCYYQRYIPDSAQSVGNNRDDIQRRVCIISDYYHDAIHNRIVELTGKDDYSSLNTLELRMYTCDMLDGERKSVENVNYVYVP